MKKLLITLIYLLPFLLHAQQQIKGTVIDASGHPLDAVTISLSQQTKRLGFALADSGRFTLNYKTSGSYTITATLVGYKAVTRQIALPKDSIKITMQADNQQLGVVTISASKPIIERKADRVTFNVENSIAASGGTAWDALSKAPGVQAKPDNSLSANKKSVRVYMDGKPLNLSGDDLANYLQGLPSDLISRIEVYSNPPSNFDAEGGSAINIITKKSKAQGFNMVVNGGYTQATFGSYTLGTSFNYRKDKLNIYGSYGHTEKKFVRLQYDYVTYATPGNSSYWYSPGYNVQQSQSDSYKLGADYELTNKQILGVLVTGMNRAGNLTTNTPTTITNNYKPTPDSTMLTNGHTNSSTLRLDYNLNYSVKLDSNGQSLNADVDYSPYHYSTRQYVNNVSFLPNGSETASQYHIFTPATQKINIYSGKLDYNYKLGKIFSLTSGVKYSSIQSSNNFDFYNNAGAEPVLISSNSDHFKYTENTAAAYTSISGNLGNLTLQGGLRAELTHTRGFSETLDSLDKKQYFKLFPTLITGYKLNEDNELQITYSYRVDRPSYALLNPTKHYATPYNYLQGNPDLQPAFVQNIEFGYTYKKEYNITAYYTSTHNMFSNITVQDNARNLFYDTFKNLGLSLNTGLRLSSPVHVVSWWEMNTMIEGYYQREASVYLQGSYNYHKFSYDGTTTQSFTINKKLGIKAEITAIYTGAGIQGIFKNSQNSEVDAGIKANILNGQGTIKLAAGDVFYGNTYHISVNYLNQNNGFYQQNDTRNGTISFSYRFGKNIAAARKRSTSSEEENKRTQ